MLHRIRLAGPWEIVRRGPRDVGPEDRRDIHPDDGLRSIPAGPADSRALSGDAARRLRLPTAWKSLVELLRDEDSQGHPVRLTRVFHRPTGLEPADRLWVGAAGWPATVHVALNGHALGRLDPWCDDQRWPITDRLLVTNRLSVDFSWGDGRLDEFQVDVGQFWLDIESS